MFFISAIFFSSCRKIPDPITTNGIIAGYASLYPNYKDDSIQVTARGPYGKGSTVTDINGLFKFKGLGNGTYSLTYSRPGYGSIKQYGIQIFGDDSVRVEFVSLFKTYSDYKIPEIERIYIGAMPRSSVTNCLIMTTKQKLGYFPILFFMSTGKEVNYRNFKYVAGHYWVRGPFETPNYDIIYIELDYLPFNHGDKIYLIGYVCNLDEYDRGYIDRYTGYEALSTLMADNHTPVMEFILP